MISLRVLSADDWPDWRDLRLAALRDAPGAFSASLADWARQDEPRWRRRLTDVPFNAVADLDRVPAGMVSGTAPDAQLAVELISMWVAPFARGRGVGDALVSVVARWAAAHGARRVVLEVFAHNGPALNLYRRNGFLPVAGDRLACDLDPRAR